MGVTIRDGFVDSDSVNALSDWAHRVYTNLLVRADDAGRLDGRLEVIRTCLFPSGTNRRAEDIKKALTEIGTLNLAILYEFAGKPYIQITKFHRRGRAEISKFPWKDGSLQITYKLMHSSDGPKDFVSTSVTGDAIPSSKKCVYCSLSEGVNFEEDHFVPKSVSGSGSADNFVTACSVCNHLKGAKVFDSIEDAASFIHAEIWRRRGIKWVHERVRRFGGKPPDDDVTRCMSNHVDADQCESNRVDVVVEGGLGVGNAHLISSKTKKSKKRDKCADLKLEIPEILKNEKFVAIWRDWCHHRTQIRHPLKSLTAQRQLVRLAEMGPDRAIAALDFSIGNGWQGIFEPPSNGHSRAETPAEFGKRNAAKAR